MRDIEHLFLEMHEALPVLWLLMDSCSTVNLICDASLLTNIHTVNKGIQVHCNAGTVLLDQQGYLGDFPTPVWYHPHGIANLMSMNNVAQQYHLTMDSQVNNEIHLHRLDGTFIPFTPSDRGLYKHAIRSIKDIATFWSDLVPVQPVQHQNTFINTVASCADNYTK